MKKLSYTEIFYLDFYILTVVIISISFNGCSTLSSKDFSSPTPIIVSFYGGTDNFQGKPTASGEVFDPTDLTAAHKTLPIGTVLKLVNPKNNRSCLARINDRGPYVSGRDLDVSKQVAFELGILKDGVTELIAEVRSK